MALTITDQGLILDEELDKLGSPLPVPVAQKGAAGIRQRAREILADKGIDPFGQADYRSAVREAIGETVEGDARLDRVRTSSDNPREFVALATDDIDADGHQWIEVMPTAEKVRNGSMYFTVDRSDLDTLAASIIEKGDRVPIDFDHSAATGKGTRAAGWFTGEADVRDTDAGPRLFARVQWNEVGLAALKSREFRFISAEWSFEGREPRTGLMRKAKEFLAATLTNRPFFSELAALAAAEGDVVWKPDEGFEALRQKVYAALNPEGVDEARYWVSDIAPEKALVQEYGAGKAWVVAFTMEGDEVRIVAQGDWVEAEQEWVATESARAARAVGDSDWLDNEARSILRARGKTLRNATEAEYAEALEVALEVAVTSTSRDVLEAVELSSAITEPHVSGVDQHLAAETLLRNAGLVAEDGSLDYDAEEYTVALAAAQDTGCAVDEVDKAVKTYAHSMSGQMTAARYLSCLPEAVRVVVAKAAA
jgi:hypothetical protein